jgi:hypothetical protein
MTRRVNGKGIGGKTVAGPKCRTPVYARGYKKATAGGSKPGNSPAKKMGGY